MVFHLYLICVRTVYSLLCESVCVYSLCQRARVTISLATVTRDFLIKSYARKKVKASHTRYRALGPKLIQVYRQSARR